MGVMDKKVTVHSIVAELICMEKYRFVDIKLIAEIVRDIALVVQGEAEDEKKH